MHLAQMLLLPAEPLAAAALLADPRFVERCVRASGATPERVAVAPDAVGGFEVSTRRVLPAARLPAHLRAFVGTRVEITQVERWGAPDEDGARAAAVAVDVVGAPVQLRGTATLVAHGAGASALRYAGDLRAAVPLVGDAVERAVADAVRAALQAIADEAHQVRRPDERPEGPPGADNGSASTP